MEGGGVKYVFLSLRRQLRCQAEGRNALMCYYMKFKMIL
jgi:hypothetical protein